jgi:hypothetical protein
LNKLKNIIPVIVFFAFSCNAPEEKRSALIHSSMELENVNEEMPIADFISWAGNIDNELTKSKEFSEINYRLSFMPAQSLAYIELRGQEYTMEQFNAACKHYDGMSYFNLRIELPAGSGELLKHGLESPNQYNDRLNYMSFKMQNDIYLVQGQDTLLPGLFHYERIFEAGSYATVMLAFDDAKFNKEKDFTIVYDDHLFNKGYIKYTYYSKQLIDLPNISGV